MIMWYYSNNTFLPIFFSQIVWYDKFVTWNWYCIQLTPISTLHLHGNSLVFCIWRKHFCSVNFIHLSLNSDICMRPRALFLIVHALQKWFISSSHLRVCFIRWLYGSSTRKCVILSVDFIHQRGSFLLQQCFLKSHHVFLHVFLCEIATYVCSGDAWWQAIGNISHTFNIIMSL